MSDQVEAVSPYTMDDLCHELKHMTSRSAFIAGGTDIVIAMRRGTVHDRLISLGDIAELKCFSVEHGDLTLGSMLTMSRLETISLPLCAEALRDASGTIGSYQIRNRATLGGNIVNASPASDMLPVLMCLDADAVVLNADGSLTVIPIRQLLRGAGKTCIPYNGIIKQISLPVVMKRVSAYGKLGYRRQLSVSRIGLALCVDLDADGHSVKGSRIYVGAIAPVPLRAEAAEEALSGQDLNSACPEAYIQALIDLTAKKSSRVYKAQAIRGIAIDTYELLRKRVDDNGRQTK